ncbi:MAG: hypothetical protein SFW66_02060 [Gammaproteobacteria bacterium]|nr:hypothetical protein [Gammaproteobacteria bacterium]
MVTLFSDNTNGPQYTVRMLLTSVCPEEKQEQEISLKKFSHFTLGCTVEDESKEISKAIDSIAGKLNEEITFKVSGIINLNTDDRPLWGVKLDLGDHENELRKIFRVLDEAMCHERNGNLYVWDVDSFPLSCLPRCPHVTIGPSDADKEKALQLVNLNCQLTFGAIDYKKTGRHDPHLSVNLSKRNKLNNPDQSISRRM